MCRAVLYAVHRGKSHTHLVDILVTMVQQRFVKQRALNCAKTVYIGCVDNTSLCQSTVFKVVQRLSVNNLPVTRVYKVRIITYMS